MDSMRMLGILFFSYVFTVAAMTITTPGNAKPVLIVATAVMLLGTVTVGVYARLTGR